MSATETPQWFKDLSKYDTPTICNAIELFDVRPRNTGYMNESIKACFPKMPPMVGYAVTSTFRSQQPPRGGDVYASLDNQVASFSALPGPAVVVFQDLDQPCSFRNIRRSDVHGLQIVRSGGTDHLGTGRDLDQVEAIGFPTFTNGTICAHGYCHTISLNVAVTVGGITVYAGDLLHGDLNGVTTIPNDIAPEVAQVCAEIMEAESIILDYCRGPNPTPDGLKEARKECIAMFNKTAARVTRKKK